MTFVGLDLGTSGLRAVLMDDAGQLIGQAEQLLDRSHPHPGWSEQNPTDWTEAVDRAMQQLRAQQPRFADVRGIAVAGHMHGATLLDTDNRVLRPCILWDDTRSHVEAARLDAAPRVRSLSGNIVFPGFTAPKLLWVRQHEPQVFDRVARVLLPAGFVNLFLTGEAVADMSDSAGTSWLDVGARDWSEPLLEAGAMRRDQMPRLVEGNEVAGTLRPELARKWGLSHRVSVAGGAGDNAAAACGIGALNHGQGFVSLGTSGVVLAARDGYHPAPETAVHTFCHAVPDRWYQMGVMLSATAALNWLGQITGATPATLTAELGTDLRAPGAVRFLPYLAGERTPHNDAGIRGAFTGLGSDTSRADLTRAVLEGVAFGLRDCADALRATGVNLDQMFVIGGGAASQGWVRMLATILNMPLLLPAGGAFGAAVGAARLAQSAVTQADVAAIMPVPDVECVFNPDKTLCDAFQSSHAAFQALYPAVSVAQ